MLNIFVFDEIQNVLYIQARGFSVILVMTGTEMN
jgi:hypothetical protein